MIILLLFFCPGSCSVKKQQHTDCRSTRRHRGSSFALHYSTMAHKVALDWQSSAESIGCFFTRGEWRGEEMGRWWITLPPWAIVAAGTFVIRMECNSCVLFPHRGEKYNLGKTERLQRGRRRSWQLHHSLVCLRHLSDWSCFSGGLCASGKRWEMERGLPAVSTFFFFYKDCGHTSYTD